MNNNSTQMPAGTRAHYESKKYSDKIFTFELVRKNPEDATMKDAQTGKAVPFPASNPIPLVGSVLMKRKGSDVIGPRRIRVAAGETSIFVDEQLPDDKMPKKTVVKNFIRGKCHVLGTDSVILDYLMMSDVNANKPGRDKNKKALFRLVDNTVIAKKGMEDDELEFDVVSWCRKGDWDTEVGPLAQIIFDEKTMLQATADIRYDLTRVAKQDVFEFKKMLDDPKTKRKIVVFAAIESGIVETDTSANTLYWKDHKLNPITQAKPGTDVIDDFILKSFSGNGEVVYNAIYAQVHPESAEETIPLPPEVNSKPVADIAAPSLSGPTDTTDELLTLVNSGIERGFITGKANTWLKYKENKAVMKVEGMVKFLRNNETILKLLKQDLGVE